MNPSLLLLHGALGSQKQFDPIIPLLEDQFDVHRFDFEGHGENVSDTAYSMKLFSQNVVEYLDKHSIEKTNVFGYSMGGYVALKTALAEPDRIGKIATLGTKFNWSLEAAQREVRMLNPDKIEEKGPPFCSKAGSRTSGTGLESGCAKNSRDDDGAGRRGEAERGRFCPHSP
jgi:pimeloyl-ACP methyl ester carboxylesterase